MFLSIITAIYFTCLFLAMYYNIFFAAGFLVIIGFLVVLGFFGSENIQKQKVRKMVEEKTEKNFININKAPWYILEEIPHIQRIEAKRIVYIRRKYGKYASKEDFFSKLNIKEEFRPEISYLISL